ncbi:DICER-LIKE 4, dicer-like 4 [Hibiscus trionum]|uniref:DICER-LIKE 4, dicer-like 4 n=1 Tax=Hibiscus trionum TaxID=183268 RepID=A0A9W7IBS7_HIBTR|nr:DICER-LIKE 4, dicer-like 4 [Hibiscus trionum]GMI92535.1 DICER-LIKE 4, dicer-like 4 [Hibiscus trionum]
MPDCELSTDGVEPSVASKAKASSPLSPIVEISEEDEAKVEKKEKDPRKIARKYQLELCKKATEENIIVYLETGCGKTHIAVLLIYELGHLIRKPQKRICIFLAPTVALVQQQARVIEDSLDFKVGTFCGNCRHLKNHHDWEKEIEQYEVLVMTPQVLLRSLYHCFVRMDLIALLIFDECHHAQSKSNHPYAEIMKVFYDKATASMLPRIFGMTASPVVGKDASSQVNLPKSINSLENLLDAKVYSVGDKEELESFVATPVVRVYDYGPVNFGPSSSYMIFCSKLEDIKRQCISTLVRKNVQSDTSMKKLLNRMHDNITFCLENLGLWGALRACQLLCNNSERNELMENEGILSDDSLCDRYLAQAADVFASDCKRDGSTRDLSDIEVLKEPFFSRKLLRLVGILSTFRLRPNMKCIIFVNRIVTARSLSYILQNLKFLSYWKCHFLVGVHSGLKSMSRKTMKNILEKFRAGELNLLVATKVGEEGLDIQTCCLVIRFDLPETVASFIQSRGRARMPLSEYAFLVNSANEGELNLINNFKKDEARMNMEITFRTSTEVSTGPEERIYTVDSSGASISSGYSISLLHHYCSKLPHDEYFYPKPSFYYFDDTGGTVCNIILPSNSPIHQIASTPQSSVDAAKKDACLKAIEELHKVGALTDHLLPLQNSVLKEETAPADSDSGSSEDEDLRGELHEMLVPAVLKKMRTNLENYVLHSYYIKFIPDPEDRSYKEFALFVKSPLPKEAERMELDLHLARHRSVMTKLVPSGVTEFKGEEIMEAQHFQEMFFKVILDRSKLLSGFFTLGNSDFLSSSSSTFYLLLPVILSNCENKMTVDWGIVQRCLSSPLFKTPVESAKNENFSSDVCLQLVNGCTSIRDVENSLVYAAHKAAFYFITGIVRGKNGYSPYRDSGSLNHVEHLKMSGIHLKYPEQPLLHAKPLFKLHNLLHNRKPEDSESQELEEYFIDLPPELCQLKLIGFSKDIGSSLSLLPSIMHRLENLLVAIELKHVFSASFPEGAEVTASRVLEALTTEKCNERFSLERLESLGDSFLKFAVGRHLFLLHDSLDEGELTRRRSNAVNNSNLFKLATRRNLQVYIRDQPFDPCQFFALGHPCPVICTKETKDTVHSQNSCQVDRANSEVRCSRNHHWLHKKTIADVVEALVGAFIVDRGFQAATAFLRWIGIRVDFQGSQLNSICAASNRFMPLSSQVDTEALENLLGYRFLHKGLLLQAIVHPSYNKHGGGCFQRLEFLGDAVLDYLITSYLFSLYPKLKPGQLTDLRSVSVNNKSFANVAVERCLHKFLISNSCPLNEAIEKYVGFFTSSPDSGLFEGPKCPKALGDLVESCFGAILLDTGFNLTRVWKIMLSLLDPVKRLSSVQLDPIREVTELCQSRNRELKFLPSKSGRNFSVDAYARDVSVSIPAINTNKKDAIRTAAHQLYVKLKALGYAPKSKSLEEVLKGSIKAEAKLIGFDETPIDVAVPHTTAFENMKLQESPVNGCNLKTRSINKTTSTSSPCISPISRPLHSSEARAGCSASSSEVKGTLTNCSILDPSSGIDSQSKGDSHNRTARSQLYEICAINFWKPPLFECCKEEGLSHLRSFTYRVVLEIEEAPDMILECFSSPLTTKKAAAEHAAEGALWYLKHEGYLQ